MKLQELQNQALQLSVSDRWQLIQTLLESLKHENPLVLKRRNLARLRGIAQSPATSEEINPHEDYTNYLTDTSR